MNDTRRPDEAFDASLAAFLDHEAGRADTLPGMPGSVAMAARVGERLSPQAVGIAPVLAVAALLLFVVVTGTLWLVTSKPAQVGGLLGEVQARSSVRIAVRPDFPQAAPGALAGYDLDVADELARRLGLSLEQVIRAPEEMLRPQDRGVIDLALPSDARIGADSTATAVSIPYYHWPVYLVVGQASAATTPSHLDGGTVCVAAGSAADGWLAGAGHGPSSTPIATPPAVTVVREATDRLCLEALERGEVDGLVTTTISPADLAVRAVRTLGGPVFTEPRSILAQRAGVDPTGLIAEVDRVLSEMQADGTLVELSQNRFGGRDLTDPAT
jgi:polar amino acid transport system substrate-binding protein